MRSDQIQWRIEREECVLAGSEDGWTEMEHAVQQLNGNTLLSADLNAGDSILSFTNHLILRTFVIY